MDRLHPLLNRLHRVFNTDAMARAAFRLDHPAGGEWTVRRGVLEARAGGAMLRVPLAPPLTVGGLASQFAAAGWRVEALQAEMRERGTAAVMDGSFAAPGPLLIHDSLLWAFMDGAARELDVAADAAARVAANMAIPTAAGEWLDVLGGYYGVPRRATEADSTYAARMAPEVLRPRSNNRAMARALSEAAQGQAARVTDVTIYRDPVPAYDGTIIHDGTYQHDASALPIYGLFDAEVAFDLLGDGNEAQFRARTLDIIERMRAGGTHLRTLTVLPGQTTDAAPGPSDEGGGLGIGMAASDAAPGPTLEGLGIALSTSEGDMAPGASDAGIVLTVTPPSKTGLWLAGIAGPAFLTKAGQRLLIRTLSA